MTSHNWIHDDGDLFDGVAPLSRDARRMLAFLDAACGTPEGWLAHRAANELPCGACAEAYHKAGGRPPLERPECGTEQGWQRHRHRSEIPCGPCAEAKAKDDAAKCGTLAGIMRHRRKGEEVCLPCAEERASYQRNRLQPHREQTCPECGRTVAWHRPGVARLARHRTNAAVPGWCSLSLQPLPQTGE